MEVNVVEKRFGEEKLGKHVFLGFYQGVSMERTSMTSRLLSCSLSLRRLFSSGRRGACSGESFLVSLDVCVPYVGVLVAFFSKVWFKRALIKHRVNFLLRVRVGAN